MRSAAARVAEAGADLIDLNMGCPVPKVCKTGAGAALLKDPDTAVAVARAAARGLRAAGHGQAARAGRAAEGFDLARRLVEEAGVAGITFHPRSRQVRHKGTPDYDLARELVQTLPVPVIVSGGMREAEHVRCAFEYTGAAAVMLARGSLGNPWLFEQVLGTREGEPAREEIARRVGVGHRPRGRAPRRRARRPLPAQVLPLVPRAPRRGARRVQDALQRAESSPSSAR